MSSISFLVNWRDFPRVRLTFRVVGKNDGKEWCTTCLDVSLGGCRLGGEIPAAVGESVSLLLAHARIPETYTVRGRMVRQEGEAAAIEFDPDPENRRSFEAWLSRAIDNDLMARKILLETPKRLPLGAKLARGAVARRMLQPAETELLAMLRSEITIEALRDQMGTLWEQRCQPLFAMVAEGLVKVTLPEGFNAENPLAVPASEVPPGLGATLKTVGVALPVAKQLPDPSSQ